MSMDREDFESDEAWKNYLDQQMTRKFSAADFANARFAEHEEGRLATRDSGDPVYVWRAPGLGFVTDRRMVDTGWVPVPTKPTITESEYARSLAGMNEDYAAGYIDAVNALGGEVIPDPEPTDEELLAGIIRGIDDWQSITSPELLAKYLNTAGVTPPKEDN